MKPQKYGHLFPTWQTIQDILETCWRNKEKLISNFFLFMEISVLVKQEYLTININIY